MYDRFEDKNYLFARMDQIVDGEKIEFVFVELDSEIVSTSLIEEALRNRGFYVKLNTTGQFYVVTDC